MCCRFAFIRSDRIRSNRVVNRSAEEYVGIAETALLDRRYIDLQKRHAEVNTHCQCGLIRITISIEAQFDLSRRQRARQCDSRISRFRSGK